jgi:hypothetical protein
MKPEPYVQMLTSSRRRRTVEGSSRRSLKRTTLSRLPRGLDQHQPKLVLRIAIGSHRPGCHYFHAGFFTNGKIGADRVASIPSIGSFNEAHLMEDGEVVYVPERSTSLLF